MGKRGPRPTPTAILEARGSRKVKGRPPEPKSDGRPACPAWLPENAKQVWRKALRHLSEMGVVGKVDANALARYCVTFARWRECEEFIQQFGMTQTYKQDGRVVIEEFPQVSRASRLSDQLLKIEREFGMTPAARVNLTPTKAAGSEAKHGIAGLLQLVG